MEPILEMRGITKAFPGVLANDQIDFSVYPGEIHALVGENGAGKSTLMSILYGMNQADSGEILIRRARVNISAPAVAIRLGIGMVFQHFMLVPPLTVAENIVLGCEPCRGLLFDRGKAVQEVARISETYGLKVDPLAKVESISVGMQQRVEIIKTLYRGAEILILDEPTAVLTPQEIQELFQVLRVLAAKGKTIIFITHKLREVMAVAQRVTVLRHGQVVGTVRTEDTDEERLARMMVGRDVVLKVAKEEAAPGPVVLEVENVSAKNDRNLPALRDISLKVRAGEILGIAGVEGNGQTELVEALTGLRPVTAGKIRIHNHDLTNKPPRTVKERKVAHIPEDRHKRGLVLPFTVAENLVLSRHYRPPFARRGRLDWNAISLYADRLIKEFDVRVPGRTTKAQTLSGGNQQKVIIARELDQEPELLIAAQPTRGVDIGAIEFIHRRIVEQRNRGKAVLLVSADLQEILALSDRIAVLFEGRIVGTVDAREATEEKLGLMMAGCLNGKERGHE